MVDCEVCEECKLYGTTGTDHCEHDCVCGALDIINKYQKIEQILKDDTYYEDYGSNAERFIVSAISEVLEDGKID